MGVDRADAYRAAALKRLPWVKVCYDAYHLVGNMNEVADKVKRAETAHPTEALKRRLEGERCHLPKAKENLKGEAGEELAGLPAYNEKPNTTYVPKEQSRTVFCADTQSAATLQPVQWLKMAVVSGVKQVEKFARGIADKFNEVINGVRYGVDPGRIESVNAGIRRNRSKCCGLFDIDCLFSKMRKYSFGGGYHTFSGFETAPQPPKIK